MFSPQNRRLGFRPRLPKIGSALRNSFKEGYGFEDLKFDLMAGVIVGMVAIPLGMGLAIASGVPPQFGLYTVIFGGATVALLGGSRFQVTGPTAAFVVILAPIVHKFGLAGLLTAGLLSGVMLVFLGVLRIGGFIKYVPRSITLGFTAGIGLTIATIQFKDFAGLAIPQMPETYVFKLKVLAGALRTSQGPELITGVLTLVLLFVIPHFSRKVPAPLFGFDLCDDDDFSYEKVFSEFGICDDRESVYFRG